MPLSVSSSFVHHHSRAAVLCLALAGILWGTGGLLGSLLGTVSGLSPLSVAAVRLLAGGALLIAFQLAARQRLPRGRAAWTRIGVLALLAAEFQAAYFGSIALTSVSLATLITIGAAPVIVQAAELAAARQRPTREKLVTLALALASLGLLAGAPAGGNGETALLGGAGLALLSAAGFAAMTLIVATPVPGLGDLAMTGYGSAFGGLALLPLALSSNGTALAALALHPSPAALCLLAALGVGPTALAYALYYRGLRSAAPSTAVLMTLLEPLTATLLGVLLLGNRLGPTGTAGMVLLSISVIITAWPRPGRALAVAAPENGAS
jgi:drug/metabolite transporter, DME family